MAIGLSLRGSLAKVVPTWLQNAPGFRNLYIVVWAYALLGDCLLEIAWEGQLATYPGVGTPTALPLIGASRGLLQGPNEPDAVFAARCIDFRATWKEAGSAQSLATEIQAFLVGSGTLGAGVYPVVRVVDRRGACATAHADQSVTFENISWHWDDTGGFIEDRQYYVPELDTWWSELWILVQDFTTHYTSFSDPNWTSAWNSGDQTLDGVCPQATVQGITQIISSFKGAHTHVRALVLVPDPTTYAPDGSQGNASKIFAGASLLSRTVSLGYWDFAGG